MRPEQLVLDFTIIVYYCIIITNIYPIEATGWPLPVNINETCRIFLCWAKSLPTQAFPIVVLWRLHVSATAQVQRIAIQLRSKENRDREKLGATRLPKLTGTPGPSAGRSRFKSEEEKRRLTAMRYAATKKEWQQGLSVKKARVPAVLRCAAVLLEEWLQCQWS